MSRKNGGIIGPANTPVGGIITGVASGVWRTNDLLNFVSNDQWPKAPQSIDNSCLFDGSGYGQRSISTAGSGTTATFSAWVKPSALPDKAIFTSYIDSNNFVEIYFNSGQFRVYHYDSGGTSNDIKTTPYYKDESAWYHFHVIFDTTNGTEADRIKMYVNGAEVTALATSNYPTSSQDLELSSSSATFNLGARNGDEQWKGYMAEVVFIDGQALTPSSFGETNTATGIWTPKKIGQIANAGTNSFYLDFKDSSNLGKDQSGLGNNFTVSGLASTDQMTDTCVNNFATMNPNVSTPDASWAEGNLQVTGSDATEYNANNTSTIGVSSGKWYMEVEYDSAGSNTNPYVGICPMSASETTNMTGSVTDACVVRMDNEIYKEGSATSSFFGSSISAGNTIGIALDMDNQKVWFHLNGTYPNSGNPATGANAAFDGITSGETMAFCVRPLNATFKFNFGSPLYSISSGNSDANGFGNFEYSVPSGFYALNTSNLNTYG